MEKIHQVYISLAEITGAMVEIEKRELAGENVVLESKTAAIAYQTQLLKLREITSDINENK